MRVYDHQWRKLRAQVLKNAQSCAICGRPLDFHAPPRSRWAPSVDHRLPVSATRGLDDSTRRQLALDPQNLVPCHYGCNSRRGDGRRDRPQHVSRPWR